MKNIPKITAVLIFSLMFVALIGCKGSHHYETSPRNSSEFNHTLHTTPVSNDYNGSLKVETAHYEKRLEEYDSHQQNTPKINHRTYDGLNDHQITVVEHHDATTHDSTFDTNNHNDNFTSSNGKHATSSNTHHQNYESTHQPTYDMQNQEYAISDTYQTSDMQNDHQMTDTVTEHHDTTISDHHNTTFDSTNTPHQNDTNFHQPQYSTQNDHQMTNTITEHHDTTISDPHNTTFDTANTHHQNDTDLHHSNSAQNDHQMEDTASEHHDTPTSNHHNNCSTSETNYNQGGKKYKKKRQSGGGCH